MQSFQFIFYFFQATTEKSSDVKEREEAFQTQLKKRLVALGNELQDKLRMTLEGTNQLPFLF